jgi:hypothetical protein
LCVTQARNQHLQHLNSFGSRGINNELLYGDVDESTVNALRAAGLDDAEIYAQIQQQKAADAAAVKAAATPPPNVKRLTGAEQRRRDRERSEAAAGSKGPAALRDADALKESSQPSPSVSTGTARPSSGRQAADSKGSSASSARVAKATGIAASVPFTLDAEYSKKKAANDSALDKRRDRIGLTSGGSSASSKQSSVPARSADSAEAKSNTRVRSAGSSADSGLSVSGQSTKPSQRGASSISRTSSGGTAREKDDASRTSLKKKDAEAKAVTGNRDKNSSSMYYRVSPAASSNEETSRGSKKSDISSGSKSARDSGATYKTLSGKPPRGTAKEPIVVDEDEMYMLPSPSEHRSEPKITSGTMGSPSASSSSSSTGRPFGSQFAEQQGIMYDIQCSMTEAY